MTDGIALSRSKTRSTARRLEEDLRGRGRIGSFGRAEAVYENDR